MREPTSEEIIYEYDPKTNSYFPLESARIQGFRSSIPAYMQNQAANMYDVSGKKYIIISKDAVISALPDARITRESRDVGSDILQQAIDVAVSEETKDALRKELATKRSELGEYVEFGRQVGEFFTGEAGPAGDLRARARYGQQARQGAGLGGIPPTSIVTPLDPTTGNPSVPVTADSNGTVMDGTRPPASVRSVERESYRQSLSPANFIPKSGGLYSNLITAGENPQEVFLFWDTEMGMPRAVPAREFVDSKTIPGKELSEDQINSMAASLQGTPYLDANYDQLGVAEKRKALRDAYSKIGQALTEYNYSTLSAGVLDPSQYLRFGSYVDGLKQRNIAGTTSTSVSLSGRGQSDVYATNAAREYLGRNPTAKEKQKFLNALNAAERAAPTVTTTTPLTDGGSSTVSTTGGVSGTLTAEEFMRRQPGSGSYQIATDYFDAFVRAVGNPTSIATPERF